jgi:hypothetical protein
VWRAHPGYLRALTDDPAAVEKRCHKPSAPR